MADQFSYANLPGYGAPHSAAPGEQNPYLTDLQRERMGYWSGERQANVMDLNTLWNEKFAHLQTLKSQDFQTSLEEQQAASAVGTTTQQGVKTAMGGDKKGSTWRKGTEYQWWNPEGGIYKSTPKYIPATIDASDPVTQLQISQGIAPKGTKFKDGKLVTKNPNWNLGKGIRNLSANMAASDLGKFGTWGAGTPTTITSLIGSGIKMFGDDRDPTTYTGWEATGDAMSWGSTAWKVAAMVNPALAAPAAIVAALISTSKGRQKAQDALDIQAEHKAKWDESVKEFRQEQRDMSKVGGTKPINMNWWSTTYS